MRGLRQSVGDMLRSMVVVLVIVGAATRQDQKSQHKGRHEDQNSGIHFFFLPLGLRPSGMFVYQIHDTFRLISKPL